MSVERSGMAVARISRVVDPGSGTTEATTAIQAADPSDAAVFEAITTRWHHATPWFTPTWAAVEAGRMGVFELYSALEGHKSDFFTHLLTVRVGQQRSVTPSMDLDLSWSKVDTFQPRIHIHDYWSADVSAFASHLAPIDILTVEPAAANSAVFQAFEPIDQFDNRLRALLTDLQTTKIECGNAIAARIRALLDAAEEEGESISLEALEAFVLFAKANPSMIYPQITLGPSGAVLAEWRESKNRTLGIYFVKPAKIQFLITRPNPDHASLVERFSGSTSLDRVGENVRQFPPLPVPWLVS